MDIDTLVEPALTGQLDFDAPVEPRRLEAVADVATPFVIELSQFSGPLDLLLSLIRDEQVDIYDIPIARIAEQFLAHIHLMQLDQAADYLEMAARLLRIKAQMLLPRNELDEAWEDPRAELVRRLLEYQQMREVVDVLERLGEERRGRFARAYVPQQIALPTAPLALSLSELLAAIDRILRLAREDVIHDVIARPLDVDGACGPGPARDRAVARRVPADVAAVAGALGAARAAGARAPRRAAARPARTLRLRFDQS